MVGHFLFPAAGFICSPRYPASGCWCVVGMAPWAGCLALWRRYDTVWPVQSHPWPSYPWAQVGSAIELNTGASWLSLPLVLLQACAGFSVLWWGLCSVMVCGSHCLTSVPGNDLGRVLRWGAGYSGEDPFSVLVSVDEADAVLMDRWTILLDAQEASSTENSVVDTEPPKVPVCPLLGSCRWLLRCTEMLPPQPRAGVLAPPLGI